MSPITNLDVFVERLLMRGTDVALTKYHLTKCFLQGLNLKAYTISYADG